MELSTIETMSGHPKKQFFKNNWHYVTNNIFNDTNYGFNNQGHFLRNRPLNFLSRVKPGHSKQLQQLTSRQVKQKELFQPRKKHFDIVTSPHSRAPPTPVQHVPQSYSPEPLLRQNQPLLEKFDADRGGRKLSQAAHNVIHRSLKINDEAGLERPQIGGAQYSVPYGRNPYENNSSLTPRLLPDINRSYNYEEALPQLKSHDNPLIRNGMSRNSFINKMKHSKLRDYHHNTDAQLNHTDIVRASVPLKREVGHTTLDPITYPEQNYRTVQEAKNPTYEDYKLPESYKVDEKKIQQGFKVSRRNEMLHQNSGESLVNFEEKRYSGPVEISQSKVIDYTVKQGPDKITKMMSNEQNSRNKFYEVALQDLQNRGSPERKNEIGGQLNPILKRDQKIKQKSQQRQIQRVADQEFKDITIGRREEKITDPDEPNFSRLKGILEKNVINYDIRKKRIRTLSKKYKEFVKCSSSRTGICQTIKSDKNNSLILYLDYRTQSSSENQSSLNQKQSSANNPIELANWASHQATSALITAGNFTTYDPVSRNIVRVEPVGQNRSTSYQA